MRALCLIILIVSSALQLNAQDSLAHQAKVSSAASQKTKSLDSLSDKKSSRADSIEKAIKSSKLLSSRTTKSIDSLNKKNSELNNGLRKIVVTPKSILQLIGSSRNHKKDSLAKTKGASTDSLHHPTYQETDSLKNSGDSVHHYQHQSLDSLHRNFNHRTDSIQRSYASPMNLLHVTIVNKQHERDSLSKKNQSTHSIDHEIDSLQRAQAGQLKELNSKIDRVKKETLSKASQLHLPPEAQKELNGFAKNINAFKVPNNFFQLPNMRLAGLSVPSLSLSGINTSLKLPSNLSIPQASIPSLQKLDLKSMKIPSLAQMEGSLGSDLKKLQSLSALNEKAIEKEAMNIAAQNKEMKSFVKEESRVKDMQKEMAQLKKIKNDSAAIQQLKPAINHFAGKEKELTSAMDKVSKLKQKYTNVTSLAELPKLAPNPLKSKPWIERLVPGINYFVQTKRYTLIDFNPYLSWRFNPKFVASIGWNERVGVSNWNFHTNQSDRVFGVRASASYLWTHGFNFKIAPELMSAYVPTTGSLDIKHKATVFGFYAGIRKDFPIYKSFKGYSEVMYNFTQKTFQNIYGDPVSFRFGVEMWMKKKLKKK
jgi:hypothetical protein